MNQSNLSAADIAADNARTDDEKLDLIAARILEKHIAAFEELAK